MAAQPTLFNGEQIEPVAKFSSAWATKLRPDFPASKPIAGLKDLHLRTPLVTDGEPACVLLVPEGRYADAAERVREAVKTRTGVELPLRSITECADPEALLADTHLITFGNMTTNPFLFRLYCRWLTLLDLKWPGRGGHALLSLHNPFGNGHNAILVGGSDDAGVAASAQRLAARISAGDELGWIHDVTLGKGLAPPGLNEGDSVRWWSGAPGHAGIIGEWGRALCFGWNSIATCACLYYMTGNEDYAHAFKRLAMSRPGHVPDDIRKDYSYWNPANPLVETYHYYSHLIPQLWDLIEEAPVFTDDERTYITNKFIEWQDHYDPNDTFATPNGSRHTSYQMLNIYTASLYLAKYYPQRRWFQRLANVREAFDAWHGNCTWGELDLVSWLPTSEEFVFNFFLLDDSWEAFAADGSAAELIGPQLHCWTGKQRDPVNTNQAVNMMHKAAWITRDPGWIWLARQADRDEDLDSFRVGQSWWPDDTLAPEPPAWAVNRVCCVPLQRSCWQRAGQTIPLELGSQFLTYRTTLDETGDCLRFDVSRFCERTPYHLATPDVLRIAGKSLIASLDSLVTVHRQGLLETARTPQIAAVTGRAGAGVGAAIALHVPNMSFSEWRRQALHRTGVCTVFVDDVTPRQDGQYDVAVNWAVRGAAREPVMRDGIGRVRTGTVDLLCAGADEVRVESGMIRMVARGDRQAGEHVRVLSILTPVGKTVPSLTPLGEGCFAWSGQALVISRPTEHDGLRFAGAAAWLDDRAVLATGVTSLRIADFALTADHPLAMSWDLSDGTARLHATVDTQLTVNGEEAIIAAGETQRVFPVPQALRHLCRSLPVTAADAWLEDIPGVAVPVLRGNARWANADGVDQVLFPDQGDYVQLTGPSLAGVDAFSLEAWVCPDRFIASGERVTSQALVSKWDVGAQARSWMLMLTRDRLGLYVSADGSFENAAHHVGRVPLAPGWTHVAATFAEGTATLFVDGAVAGTFVTGPLNDCDTPIVLGRYLPGGYPFAGALAGLRISRAVYTPEQVAAHAQAGPGAPLQEDPASVFTLRAPAAIAVPQSDWDPRWSHTLPGAVRHLAVAPPECGGTVWVACARGLLAVLDEHGRVRRETSFPDEITSLAVAPDAETLRTVAAVVGLDNDEVYGLSADGECLWQEKAEIHPRFWLDGHWRAPWFTDPKSCHGVLALTFVRWEAGQPAQLALGRACTVELRQLDGTLIERIPVEWGDRATLVQSMDADGRPQLVAANWMRSLGPNMQRITAERRTGGSVYHRLPGTYTRIPGQGQGFRFPLLADLDGDGREEFAAALCGSWNDLVVYDARTQEPKWARVFGSCNRSGRSRAWSLVSAVRAGDVDGDGTRAVAVSARNGWLWLFGAHGEVRWARQLGCSIEDAVLVSRRIIAGLADGTLRIFDAEGERLRQAALTGAVTCLAEGQDGFVAASDAGEVAAFVVEDGVDD